MGPCAAKDAHPVDREELKPDDQEDPLTPRPRELGPTDPKLVVAIWGARGLRNADWLPGTGTSDCYCALKIAGKDKELHRTRVINDSLEPIWKEEFDVVEFQPGDSLEFVVWDSDVARKDLIGRVTLDSSAFEPDGFNGELRLDDTGKAHRSYLRVKVRRPYADFPRGPDPAIVLTVDRQASRPLGLDLDTQDGVTAYVTGIKAGPFQAYNEGVEPGSQLQVGDFIMRVNGAENDAGKLLAQLRAAARLEVTVNRPLETAVILERVDRRQPHGLEFTAPTGSTLVVTRVIDGAARDWNAAHPDRKILSGDRIIAVDGKRGRAKDLLKSISSASKCQLIIARPATPIKPAWTYW
mmetsp:Transcript_6063/g.17943  ORF Transcript_6063/g.17943 Transcript_6063/m.17943 type:complete len:353 (-) Transcript_6063:292-1350(-)